MQYHQIDIYFVFIFMHVFFMSMGLEKTHVWCMYAPRAEILGTDLRSWPPGGKCNESEISSEISGFWSRTEDLG